MSDRFQDPKRLPEVGDLDMPLLKVLTCRSEMPYRPYGALPIDFEGSSLVDTLLASLRWSRAEALYFSTVACRKLKRDDRCDDTESQLQFSWWQLNAL